MAKKILALFVVSILLCSYIIPTTSALADVVIGDNDSYAVTELGVENGKKIATMEAILQLLESGVSEINFNDISDLDDYLEEFYDELTNVNYQDVSNEILAGAYNDVKELRDWIDDRGEYIATYYKDYLNSADEGLSDIFNDFQLRLPKTKLTGTSLNGFKSLSRFNGETPTPEPVPHPDFSFLDNIAYLYVRNMEFVQNLSVPWAYNNGSGQVATWNFQRNLVTYYSPSTYLRHTYIDNNYMYYGTLGIYNGILTVNYNTQTMQAEYYGAVPFSGVLFTSVNGNNIGNSIGNVSKNYGTYNGVMQDYMSVNGSAYNNWSPRTDFTGAGLSTFCNYIYNQFANINIYVDGQPWVICSQVTINPSLDIDGFIKLYGNDNPIQYEFPQGIQIDYNALYTTIYNAIRDNLPLDMQTINNNQVYYDSHDTVYSPTIYNYYGKDGDDENDWIDSILDYATIPDFNATLGTVAVLDAPFVNGITIVNAGVTDVIPSDILLIFGGFFVLVLFVCIINRMSE